MSTDNAARYYWGKFDKAIAIFKAGNLEEASSLCLELGNAEQAGSHDRMRQYLVRLPNASVWVDACLRAVLDHNIPAIL
jgi:hypothetical protein